MTTSEKGDENTRKAVNPERCPDMPAPAGCIEELRPVVGRRPVVSPVRRKHFFFFLKNFTAIQYFRLKYHIF